MELVDNAQAQEELLEVENLLNKNQSVVENAVEFLTMMPEKHKEVAAAQSICLGPMLEKAIKNLEYKSQQQGEKSQMMRSPAKVVRPVSSPLRRSERRRLSVDEDSIERAARLVAKRNLEEPQGNLQSHVLDSIMGAAAKEGRQTPYKKWVSCA